MYRDSTHMPTSVMISVKRPVANRSSVLTAAMTGVRRFRQLSTSWSDTRGRNVRASEPYAIPMTSAILNIAKRPR